MTFTLGVMFGMMIALVAYILGDVWASLGLTKDLPLPPP